MASAAAPYEVPTKTEMRERCEVAIDQAGHELVSAPVAIALPDSGLQGRLRGDLQSIDTDGVRHCYYVRPVVEDLLPQWLVDFGQNVRRVPNVRLIVVYTEASPDLERSCRASGAGLVILTDDNRFEQIVDFDSLAPESLAKELSERVKGLRRELDSSLDIQRQTLTKRIAEVNELTAGMTEDMAVNFLSNLETNLRKVEEWSVHVSRRLDALAANFNESTFNEVRSEIQAGIRYYDGAS